MPTILDLFEKLKQMDEELAEFQFEDQKEIMVDTKEKITAYFEVRSRLLSEMDEADERMALLQVKKGRITRQVERLDNYLIAACKSYGVNEFPGFGVTLKMISQKRVKPKFEPTDETHRKFPGYCRKEESVRYMWDRELLLSNFKAKVPAALEIAEEYTTDFIRFKV